MISHNEYNTKPNESKAQKSWRHQRIRCHWVAKWFNYQELPPRYAKLFAFHSPWGDVREIPLIPQGAEAVRPPPPANPHQTSVMTPEDFPQEVIKHCQATEKRAKQAAKREAKEVENVRLLKGDLEKQKAKGRTKRVHDPNASSSSRKQKKVNKRRRSEEEDSSDQDDPPMTHEELQAQSSEQVNITTSTIVPDLRAPQVQLPPKKTRKTPVTTVTMKQHVVVPPLCSLKPGEEIPDVVHNAAQAEQVAPSTSVAADPIPAPKDIPDPGLHAFDINFIMEQLDRFFENPFDGNVEELPIPSEIRTQA
jgi:hypothetical protein